MDRSARPNRPPEMPNERRQPRSPLTNCGRHPSPPPRPSPRSLNNTSGLRSSSTKILWMALLVASLTTHGTHDIYSRPGGELNTDAPSKHLQPPDTCCKHIKVPATMTQPATTLQQDEPTAPVKDHHRHLLYTTNAPTQETEGSYSKHMQDFLVEYLPGHNSLHPSLQDPWSPPSQTHDEQHHHGPSPKVRHQGTPPEATKDRQTTPGVTQPTVEVPNPMPERYDPRA